MRIVVISAVGLSLAILTLTFQAASYGQDKLKSVLLYEELVDRLPKSTFDLNLCKLVEHKESSFYATPKDREPLECDLSKVKLAYGGWCRAGIEDKKGPHFSQPYMPYIRIEQYRGIKVVYVNNYLKSFVQPESEDIEEANRWLRAFKDNPTLPLDIREPSGYTLFLGKEDAVPLRKVGK